MQIACIIQIFLKYFRLPIDDTSLKGFVSEQVRRESILPPAGTLDNPSCRGGYQADEDDEDDSSMEGDSTNHRMAVGDLLDEASENEDAVMDPDNVVLRRRPQTVSR